MLQVSAAQGRAEVKGHVHTAQRVSSSWGVRDVSALRKASLRRPLRKQSVSTSASQRTDAFITAGKVVESAAKTKK
eukprot:1190885-Prorocentrum_minimum.AAC.5